MKVRRGVGLRPLGELQRAPSNHRRSQVEVGLHVHPELRRRLEELRQAERRVGGDSPAPKIRGATLAVSAIMAHEDSMKTVAATEAKNRLGAILDDAQREPIVIRRQDRDIAVVLSMADYERLRTGNIQAFLDLRNEVAVAARAKGLTDKRLAKILNADGA